LIRAPSNVPWLYDILFARIRGVQAWNEQHRFHAAVQAIHGLTGARYFEEQRSAAEVAITMYSGSVHGHHLTVCPLIRYRLMPALPREPKSSLNGLIFSPRLKGRKPGDYGLSSRGNPDPWKGPPVEPSRPAAIRHNRASVCLLHRFSSFGFEISGADDHKLLGLKVFP